jgi:hypothetical protein
MGDFGCRLRIAMALLVKGTARSLPLRLMDRGNAPQVYAIPVELHDLILTHAGLDRESAYVGDFGGSSSSMASMETSVGSIIGSRRSGIRFRLIMRAGLSSIQPSSCATVSTAETAVRSRRSVALLKPNARRPFSISRSLATSI